MYLMPNGAATDADEFDGPCVGGTCGRWWRITATVAIGSRWHDKGSKRTLLLWAGFSSKLYNWWVRVILFPFRKITDTQRGLSCIGRIFSKDHVRLIQRISFFLFGHCELLLLVQNLPEQRSRSPNGLGR